MNEGHLSHQLLPYKVSQSAYSKAYNQTFEINHYRSQSQWQGGHNISDIDIVIGNGLSESRKVQDKAYNEKPELNCYHS
jgi:hypothetical protein